MILRTSRQLRPISISSGASGGCHHWSASSPLAGSLHPVAARRVVGPWGTFPQSSNWKLFLTRHGPAPGYTGQRRSGGMGGKDILQTTSVKEKERPLYFERVLPDNGEWFTLCLHCVYTVYCLHHY